MLPWLKLDSCVNSVCSADISSLKVSNAESLNSGNTVLYLLILACVKACHSHYIPSNLDKTQKRCLLLKDIWIGNKMRETKMSVPQQRDEFCSVLDFLHESFRVCVPLLMTWQSRRNELHVFKAGLNSALGFHQHYGLCSKVVQVTVVYMEDYIFPLILRFLK